MMLRAKLMAALLAIALGLPLTLAAEDVPLKVAGTDVAVPKRTKFVAPVYPPSAQAQGLRGIVILELVIDEQGKVASADVVRSVPPFDEAALEAVRQWEYEVTKVDGVAVRVRHTLPITFALKLPPMDRQAGVPELRQGVAPLVPSGSDRSASVKADVTLHKDGSVADAAITEGDSPFAEALLQAVRTWRFAPEADEQTVVSFRVEADFQPGRTGTPGRVDLKLKDARRTAAAPEAQASPTPAAMASPVPPTPAAPTAPESPAVSPMAAPSPTAPAQTPAPRPAATPPPPVTSSPTPTAAPSSAPTPPPVEVIAPHPAPPGASPATAPTAAPTPTPVRTEPGFSAIRDVTLGPGVPDLAKGRRPIVPPLARMSGASGVIELQLAVDAAGGVSVQNVTGPDLLREAARQAALSWGFRRTTAERLYLVATFTYTGDQARADVRRAQ